MSVLYKMTKQSQFDSWFLFLYLLMITISLVVTSHHSRLVVVFGRSSVVLVLVFFMFFDMLNSSFLLSIITQRIFLFLMFVFYGLMLAYANNSLDHAVYQMEISIPIIVIGIYVFSKTNAFMTEKTVFEFIIFAVVAFAFTVITGGFVFSNPPQFVFEHMGDPQNITQSATGKK